MVRAMRRNSRALHIVRRLTVFFASLLFTLVVSSVYAASGSVRVTPISSVATTPSTTRTTFEVATVSLDAVVRQTEYQSRSAALSSKSLGSLARKGLRGGVYGVALGIAIDGVIDGAGWAIGELQDQVLDGPVVQPDTAPAGTEMVCLSGQGKACVPASTPLALCPAIRRQQNTEVCKDARRSGYFVYYTVTAGGGTFAAVINIFATDYPIDGTGYQPNPVSDEQLGDAIKQHPELVNELLTDPRTGYPMMTPELQKQIDDIKREVEQREGLPESDPTPAPDLDDDTATNNESSWPTFCGWASAVCEFFKWVKTDDTDTEKPETPWEEEDPAQVTQSWSSGLGGGSCPSPVSFTVSLGGQSATPEFSFSPICQFGTMMRPVIIALATIIAGFIVAGVRGTKDA